MGGSSDDLGCSEPLGAPGVLSGRVGARCPARRQRRWREPPARPVGGRGSRPNRAGAIGPAGREGAGCGGNRRIDLPGYPDSHGCVRLPLEFSKLLFGVTMKGATVIIADTHSAPAETVHPGLFFARSGGESEPEAAGQFEWNPDKSSSGPVALIVSSADKTVYVYRNGVEIGRAGIANAQAVSALNDRVFSALQGTDPNGHLRWVEVTTTRKDTSSESLFVSAQKSGVPTDFLTKARQVITPGATLIFTNKPIDPTTQSHPGFQLVVAQKDKPSGTIE